MKYRTRFAPSPTGPLHLGHAYSAIVGHQRARARGGAFLLRMEDTDLQRSKPEWAEQIKEDLHWLGLSWDGPVLYQSRNLQSYDPALRRLESMNLLYPCSCSRTQIQAALAAPQEDVRHEIYPGTCKHRSMASRRPGDALRLHLDLALDLFGTALPRFAESGAAHGGDRIISPDQALAEIGDIVIARKGDGLVAYFLASALDDAGQAITEVVRGEDLFGFTPIQVILLSLLGLPVPCYHHHRLIRDDTGKRLAKRDDARSIETYRTAGASPEDVRAMVGI